MMSSGNIHNNVHKFCSSKRRHFSDEGNYGGDCGSLKWMIPSKITKITQEEMHTTNTTTTSSSNFSEIDHNPMKFTLKFRNQQLQDSEINSSSIILNKNNNNDNNNIKVCSDCNTTTTPLWRSGPRGAKSLCNACGIRQRKARRAMAAAAAGTSGTVTPTEETSSTKFKKKCRTSHVVQCKNMWKPLPDYHLHRRTQKKNCFKKLALHYLGKNSGLERVFPKDVEEAAILLMELSCGFFHT